MADAFYGVKSPARRRTLRGAVLGPSGPFFSALLKASAYVELYDDEFGYEPFRRGLHTERVAASRLTPKLKELTDRGVFTVLAGYRAFPGAPPTGADAEAVICSPAGGAEVFGAAAAAMKTVLAVGHRSGKPPDATALWTAREAASGKPPPVLRRKGAGRTLLLIDPFVFDPALFPAAGNVEPGGLQWHPFAALVRRLFERRSPAAAFILHRALPAGDPWPAFILARTVARILAGALADR